MNRILNHPIFTHPVAHVARYTLVLTATGHAIADYIGYPVKTEGPSMLPTLHVWGDFVWLSTRYRRGRWVQVGDVVSFRHPWDPSEWASKRVIGMPGDFVLRDASQLGGKGREEERKAAGTMIQVPEGHVWLEGDNGPWSRDSRDYGPLPLGLVRGKAVAIIWPWRRWQWIERRFMEAPEADPLGSAEVERK